MTGEGMPMAPAQNGRTAARIAVDLPVTLGRAHGNPVHAHTVDVSTGGARIQCDRPLRTDEVLDFDLECDGGATHVCGRCTVLREHAGRTYAVRFERLPASELKALERALAVRR
jgi:hypothetical protein